MSAPTRYDTPVDVARAMVRSLNPPEGSTLIDPACGSGSLLAAAMVEYPDRRLNLIGVEVRGRTLSACRRQLEALKQPGQSVRLIEGDFLDVGPKLIVPGSSTYVVMNPPFVRYQAIGSARRKQLRKSHGERLPGKFNLADAFLMTCLAMPGIERISALIPTSVFARFERTIKAVRGRWHPLPDHTFSATIATGWATWSGSHAETRRMNSRRTKPSLVEARNGVATGADAVFVGIAMDDPGVGQIVQCARGRDLKRSVRNISFPRMWVPPQNSKVLAPAPKVSPAVRRTLAARFCVRVKGQSLFSFHEGFPDWFLGRAKILLPEVCCGLVPFRDAKGEILPLHSVLAVRVRHSTSIGAVIDVLGQPATWAYLKKTSPRMAGGGIRLTTTTLQRAIEAGLKRSRSSSFKSGIA